MQPFVESIQQVVYHVKPFEIKIKQFEMYAKPFTTHKIQPITYNLNRIYKRLRCKYRNYRYWLNPITAIPVY